MSRDVKGSPGTEPSTNFLALAREAILRILGKGIFLSYTGQTEALKRMEQHQAKETD